MMALLVPIGFLWLLVSLWAGLDARTNSPQNPTLWGLTVFFGGLAGFFLYLNLGRTPTATDAGERLAGASDRPALRDCPNCHARELATADECRFCGSKLDDSPTDGPWFADRARDRS